MKYEDVGFRALYKQYSALEMNDAVRTALQHFPGAKGANCALVYGYIDREAGLMLEVLAACKQDDKGFRFAAGRDDIRSFIRVGAVKDVEFYHFNDDDGSFAKTFAKKLEMIQTYDARKDVEESRGFGFLDEFRNDACEKQAGRGLRRGAGEQGLREGF